MKPNGTDIEVPAQDGLDTRVDRRGFLKGSAGLVVFFFVPPAGGAQEPARLPTGRQGYPTDFNAYLQIGPDGRVTCFSGKVELGQGPGTSLPQLVAEELNVPLGSVDVVLGDTDRCPWDMGTFGSLTIRQFGPILRQAAAEARGVLLELASERLGVPQDRLALADGIVSDRDTPSKRVSYGELTEGRRIERHLAAKPALEPVQQFTIVGRPAKRRDARDKVTGAGRYAGDVLPAPGTLHARILRPPAHGARLVKVDVSAAERRPGVTVVRDEDLVAVLHAHWDEADRALGLVKAEFARQDPPVDDRTIFDHLVKSAPPPQTAAEAGTIADGEARASRIVEHTWLDSYMAHAPMEPHVAVAAMEGDKLTVWAGTQTPFSLKSQVMQALKLPPEKVRVIVPYVGGGFGGKSASQQGVEAARLASLTGKPVRVQWSRAEEFFYDTFRPAAVVHIRSGVDAEGRIAFWEYDVVGAGERGAAHFYDIPHHRTTVRGSWSGSQPAGFHPFAVGPWRAPGASTNAFARESHIDVMAAALKADPVAFRLRNLQDRRMIRVVETAAKTFGWTPAAAPSGRGVGVACGIDAGTYVAVIAQVRVDEGTGAVRVERLVCSQDMGVVVNPDGALQQVEGCLTMGLGYALSEEVHFKGGEVLDRNFDTYQLPRFSWLPRLEAVLIEAPEIPAQGGGEPAIVPVGAAIGNAIHDAVGVRLTRLPMTPERVKEASRPGTLRAPHPS